MLMMAMMLKQLSKIRSCHFWGAVELIQPRTFTNLNIRVRPSLKIIFSKHESGRYYKPTQVKVSHVNESWNSEMKNSIQNEPSYVLWLLSLKPLWRVNSVSFYISSYLFGPQILGKPAPINIAVLFSIGPPPIHFEHLGCNIFTDFLCQK